MTEPVNTNHAKHLSGSHIMWALCFIALSLSAATQGAESNKKQTAACRAAELLGFESSCEQETRKEQEELNTYLRAIQEGKLVLVEPYTKRDLADRLLEDKPVEHMFNRVDDQERLAQANQKYNTALAELEILWQRCVNLDDKRVRASAYINDTSDASRALQNNPYIATINQDNSAIEAISACASAPAINTELANLSQGVISAVNTALEAKAGALARYQRCEDIKDYENATTLLSRGIFVARGAAKRYVQAKALTLRLENIDEQVDGARVRVNVYTQQLADAEVQRKTIKYRLDAQQGMIVEIASLEESCRAGAHAAAGELNGLTPILGDQARTQVARAKELIRAASTSQDFERSKASISQLALVNANVKKAQGKTAQQRKALNSCSVDTGLVHLGAMNQAMLALPSDNAWTAEAGALEGPCRIKIFSTKKDDSDSDSTEDDSRDTDFEGYDDDSGNIDSNRVGDNGIDYEGATDEGWTEGGATESGQQNTATQGNEFDDAYVEDGIAQRERDSELAASEERVAAAGNWGTDGRSDAGNDIADEYSDAPDTDKLPDPNRHSPHDEEHDEGHDGETEHDNTNEPPASSAPQEESPDPETETEEQPPTQEQPEEPTTDTDDETPTAPKPPPANPPIPKPPEPKPAPPKPPAPNPTPAPPATDARCEQIANSLQPMVAAANINFTHFQSAVGKKDDAAAKSAGCAILTDAERFLDVFDQLSDAKCSTIGNISSLRNAMMNYRQAVRSELRSECGVSNPVKGGKFQGTWRSAGTCASAGKAQFRWVVELEQTGKTVTGDINFHKCPGEGRVQYRVRGEYSGATTLQMEGVRTDSRGPLGDQTARSVSFTIRKNAAPSPNYAP